MHRILSRFVFLRLSVLLVLVVCNGHAQRFFEPTEGPQGSGLFLGLAAAPDGTFFASDNTDGGSIYRSTDDGRHWQLTSRSDMAFGQGRVTPMLARPNRVVLAVYTTFSTIGSPDWKSRLYRSDSNGDSASWQWITGLDSVGRVIALLPGEGGAVVAVADSGLFRSNDNGLQWSRVAGVDGRKGINGAVSDDGVMFALTIINEDSGPQLLRSTDDGSTWEMYGDSLPPHAGFVGSPGGPMTATRQNSLLVPTGATTGLMRLDSTSGSIWVLSNIGLPPSTSVTNLAVGIDGTVFAGTMSGIYRSSDDGRTWTLSDFTHLLPTNAFAVYGATFLVANRGSIFRSENNGVSFTLSGEGITHTNTSAMVISRTGTIITSIDDIVFHSSDRGGAWAPSYVLLPKTSKFGPLGVSPSGTVLAGTSPIGVGPHGLVGAGGLIYRSTNDGADWQAASVGLSATDIYDIVADGQTWYAASDSGMYRSTDDGANWEQVNNGLPTRNTRRVVVAPDRTVLVGTNGSGTYRSTDNGSQWLDANTGSSATQVRTLLAADDGTLYMGNTSGSSFYRSDNGGEEWTDLSASLPPLFRIWAAAVNRDGTIFLSCLTPAPELNGLNLRSTNRGESWETMSDSLFYNRAVFDTAGRMYVASNGNGIWRSIGTTLASAPARRSTNGLQLFVSSDGDIRYELPQAGHTRLALFDALGREVRVLMNGEREAGVHGTMLDATDLADGLYYVRLQCDGASAVQAMRHVR